MSTMADKRKGKKKLQDTVVTPSIEDKPSSEEYAVGKYLKKLVPTKRTKFLNHPVNYFSANKAVDILLDSPWSTGKTVLFTDRQSVVDYCDKLLKHKFFHRARKVPITDRDLKPKDLKRKKEKEEKKRKEELKKKKDDLKIEAAEVKVVKESEEKKEDSEGKKEDNEDADGKEKKKKKGKIKLDMHLEQVFVDGTDAYVWMYDPIPFWYYIAGSCVVFGAIAICLFPLWPSSVRLGVYYLSLAAAGFLGFILGLVVLRFIIFTLIWASTLGHHHFWLLPNLTEDVGFFASFWPLFKYEYRGVGYEKKKKRKKKKDDDDDGDTEDGGTGEGPGNVPTLLDTENHETTDGERCCGSQQEGESGSDSEHSNSQTFEMVEKEDLGKEVVDHVTNEDK